MVAVLDWLLSWSGVLGFAMVLAAPVFVARYGVAGAGWSMLLIGLLSAASFCHFWTADIEDEALIGHSNAVGLLMSVLLAVLGFAVVAVTLGIRKLMSSGDDAP
ncbi:MULTISPECIES: hypothetical protein [Sphingopyxis]|uniref:hypothetical protein n=1 Tax=Sphingopyxis TaxID=165697 RepID=UPI00086DA1B9|nr:MULTISPECIES: hypothetical protein [Sphingopyxis]APW73749.1 hypothetical protein BWD40_13900 [Sphingopyxis granuli]ODU28292.1 MAG: hypothetical protein ABS88_13425 [Sphingopyxis sp. SCN 67-31]QUM73216.1 hypothetical protein ICN83_04780 [Sphingopyxis granuli]